MEFKIVEESKNQIEFELPGETHTFCNALKEELKNIKGVEAATYRIDHPLVGTPRFFLATKSIDPRKVLQAALKALKHNVEDFKKGIKEL